MADRFRRITTATLVRTPWFALSKHTVADAQRQDAAHEVYSFDMADWVQVLAETTTGELVFVRQHRFGTQQDSLEIPGGLIDPGESPRDAAARELREETGYVSSRWRAAGWCYPNPAMQGNKLYTFIASECTKAGAPELDPLEDCQVELVPRAALRALLAGGAVTHALVLVTLYAELAARAGEADARG